MSKKKKPKQLYALNPAYHRRPTKEHMDIDYIDKLDESQKIWLNQFCQEYYRAYFAKDEKPLHNAGPKPRKRCYDANNAANRDLWTKSNMESLEDIAALEHETEDGDEQD